MTENDSQHVSYGIANTQTYSATITHKHMHRHILLCYMLHNDTLHVNVRWLLNAHTLVNVPPDVDESSLSSYICNTVSHLKSAKHRRLSAYPYTQEAIIINLIIFIQHPWYAEPTLSERTFHYRWLHERQLYTTTDCKRKNQNCIKDSDVSRYEQLADAGTS